MRTPGLQYTNDLLRWKKYFVLPYAKCYCRRTARFCENLQHFLEVSQCIPNQLMAPLPARSDERVVQSHQAPSLRMAVSHQALCSTTCPTHAATGSVHLAWSAPWTLGSQTEPSGVHAPAIISHMLSFNCSYQCKVTSHTFKLYLCMHLFNGTLTAQVIWHQI